MTNWDGRVEDVERRRAARFKDLPHGEWIEIKKGRMSDMYTHYRYTPIGSEFKNEMAG